MRGKAEKRMSQGLLLIGCFLALTNYKALAVLFWMAGVAWRSELERRTYD